MQMMSVKSNNFIVSVFFDMEGCVVLSEEDKVKLQCFTVAVKDAFEHKFSEVKASGKDNYLTPVSTCNVTCSQLYISSHVIQAEGGSTINSSNEVPKLIWSHEFTLTTDSLRDSILCASQNT